MYGERRLATGFYMEFKNKVYLVTNKHVCDASINLLKKRVLVTSKGTYNIKVISKVHDLCLAETSLKKGLKLSRVDVVPLDKVTISGHPDGDALIIRSGRVIEAVSLQFNWIGQFEVDVTLTSVFCLPGSSGSPATNEEGEVIGVLFSGQFAKEISVLVPHKDLKLFMEKHAR